MIGALCIISILGLWIIYDGIQAISTRETYVRGGRVVEGKKAVTLGWIRIVFDIFYFVMLFSTWSE